MTESFNHAVVPTVAPAIDIAAPKKRGWLPLLTVLFCISYGLITVLIVEQGSTIESQRALIHELFRDSTELSAVKMKAQRAKAVADARHAQSPATNSQAPSTRNPSSRFPSTQAPAQQAPSSQATPQQGTQNQTAKSKPQFKMPSRPAVDVTDVRRALMTI